MTATKTEIIKFVENLSEDNASLVLGWLTQKFNNSISAVSWDVIEEVEPDEDDLEMLYEVENNIDCQVFISEDEMQSSRQAQYVG